VFISTIISIFKMLGFFEIAKVNAGNCSSFLIGGKELAMPMLPMLLNLLACLMVKSTFTLMGIKWLSTHSTRGPLQNSKCCSKFSCFMSIFRTCIMICKDRLVHVDVPS